jgi:hypothetical protein
MARKRSPGYVNRARTPKYNPGIIYPGVRWYSYNISRGRSLRISN